MLASLSLASFIAVSAIFMLVYLVIGLFFYVYSGLTLMAIAKRTNTEHAWFAWIPFLNIYLVSQVAREAGWPVLLVLVPVILVLFPQNTFTLMVYIVSIVTFVVFNFFWWWKVCRIRGKPGWWILLTIIPILGWIWGLIMMGILAWGKGEMSVPTPTV